METGTNASTLVRIMCSAQLKTLLAACLMSDLVANATGIGSSAVAAELTATSKRIGSYHGRVPLKFREQEDDALLDEIQHLRVRPLLDEADCYLSIRDWERAATVLRAAAQAVPDSSRIRHELADVLAQVGNGEEAARERGTAIQLEKRIRRARLETKAITREFDAAKSALQHIIDSEPNNIRLWILLGHVQVRLAEFEQATVSFRQAHYLKHRGVELALFRIRRGQQLLAAAEQAKMDKVQEMPVGPYLEYGDFVLPNGNVNKNRPYCDWTRDSEGKPSECSADSG